MLAESTICPAELRLEFVSGGKATVRARWGIQGILVDGSLSYRYEEAIIEKELPASYVSGETTISISTREDVENYLTSIKDDIITQAKMTKFEV